MTFNTCFLRLAPGLALVLMALLSMPARAACVLNYVATTVSIPKLVVARDAPIGSLVAEGTSATIQPYNCTGETTPAQFGVKSLGTRTGFTSPDGAIIYQLGSAASGLGYAVKATSVSVCPGNTAYIDGGAPFIGSALNKLLCSSAGGPFAVPATGNIKYEIYKIANAVAPGNIARQEAAVFIMWSGGAWTGNESKVLISSIAVSQVACAVTNKSIMVPMGAVKTTDFTTQGTTAGTTAFNVPLSCDANTKVVLTLSAGGAGAADSTRGILNLDSSNAQDVASGVKLQMLYNNMPVALDTPIPVGTVSTSGAYNIPLTARYYRSAGSITAGQANASATLTISYQ